MSKKQNNMEVMETEAQYAKLILRGQDDIEWYNNNFNELVRKFNEQFIAIEHHEVIEMGPNLYILLKKLKEKGINPVETLIKFVSTAKVIL